MLTTQIGTHHETLIIENLDENVPGTIPGENLVLKIIARVYGSNGDFDLNRRLSATDLEQLTNTIQSGEFHSEYDVNVDLALDQIVHGLTLTKATS